MRTGPGDWNPISSAAARGLFAAAAFAFASPALLGAEGAREAGWAWRPLVRPAPPVPRSAHLAQNPIDLFILAKLEEKGLEPAPPADRLTLVRRLTLDLTGLPPEPADADAFTADASPEAYDRLLDRLLASPRHGERWARHWLDLARFSESHGFEYDKIRDNAWRFRDYVIASFNADLPYPRFIREQLAGDVLEPVTPEGIAATGFLVAGPWDEVGALQQSSAMKARVREEELEDMIGAVSQTFLGLTANCARCHDHKFDPIPQRDYYRLKAVFAAVRHGDRPLLTPREAKERGEEVGRRRAELAAMRRRLAEIERAGRARAFSKRGARIAALPTASAAWDFERSSSDSVSGVPGKLEGGARVEQGRLVLPGKGACLRTEPLPRGVREKTLEAWVALGRLDQRGGGVMSLEAQEGGVFDAIAFGEREEGKWVAGSDNYVRTEDLKAPREDGRLGGLVHLAITYGSGDRIAVYRNGRPYGEPYTKQKPAGALPEHSAGAARILFGLRHTGAGNGYLEGEIEEARLYERALTADEVLARYDASPWAVPVEEALAELTDAERSERAKTAAGLAAVEEAIRALETAPLAYAANSQAHPPVRVLLRGDIEKEGELVSAGGLSAAGGLAAELGLDAGAPEGERRLRFAEWVASPQNPLTARVIVNRIWQHHFGRGIAGTPNDFGLNGERPSHPELLDWLASELIREGWSLKRIQRLIVQSAAYRRSPRWDPRAAEVDADNRLLWRFRPLRLEGEAVRDSMLAASGELDLRMYGPGFRPFTVRVFGSHHYTLNDIDEPERHRRTIYRHVLNSERDPLLDSLDCPEPSVKTPSRVSTTTPLQSLALMNSAFVEGQSRRLAARVEREAGPGIRERVALAYRLALARGPSPEEAARAETLVAEHGLESLSWVLFNTSEFLYLR